MRMLKDKVLINPAKKAKISDVIVLTEDTTAKPQPFGRVLAIGPEVREVAIGDLVHFENLDWNVAPNDCIVVAEGEILAKEN